MTPDELAHLAIVRDALAGMRERGPRKLSDGLEFTSKWESAEYRLPSASALLALLKATDINDPLRVVFHEHMAAWDFERHQDWIGTTSPNTAERRELIYRQLGLDADFREWCDDHVPMWQEYRKLVEIDLAHPRWYNPADPTLTHFYWTAYSTYLRAISGWPSDNVEVLNDRSNAVIQRLACPWSDDQRQTRGLVVGYVQSGKTANFTAVVAKAADAGYRLIIILAGTLDLLRSQTQRRLDKELVGQELLEKEYVDDEDWSRFLSHGGGRPSQRGAFDIERLTGRSNDYQPLGQGIKALEFSRQDPSQPLYAKDNVRHERARIMVVKKHQTILARVATDLGRLHTRLPLEQIPTLIIDDESDQASINTRRPTAREKRDRTAINKAIVHLMDLLPRAQYIGYTATPMANFFIDPEAAEDLFPQDYIIPLPRPTGYMGMTDFHDLGDDDPQGFDSNKAAFVRDVDGADRHESNLPMALDSFVLSGAIKLWRAARNPSLRFRHHTMLVHVASQRSPHRRMRDLVERLWEEAGYEAGEGPGRLARLFVQDFLPVMRNREADPELIPDSYEELVPFVGPCVTRIGSDGDRVLVVNSDPDSEDPDFDRRDVWKILVGGTKLSRGYTIEGLTVSYYRRRAGQVDTLVQMGRWFGFRHGYSDLVRLFIGRNEQVGKGGGTIDLYRAFEGACRDELALREEFERYALKDGHRVITPAEVPPLVTAHVLPPTSKSKMYNARIQFQNFSKKYVERTQAPCHEPAAERRLSQANARRMAELLGSLVMRLQTVEYEWRGGTYRFDAHVGEAEHGDVLRYLSDYQWTEEKPVLEPVLTFLRRDHRQINIGRWIVLSPKTEGPADLAKTWTAGRLSFPIRQRGREGDGLRYGVFTEPIHRRVAHALAGVDDEVALRGQAAELGRGAQAVLLFYPVRDADREPEKFVTMGFGLQFPENQIPEPIRFGVRRNIDAVVIDRDR